MIKLAGQAFSELGDTTFELFFLGACLAHWIRAANMVAEIGNLIGKLNKFSSHWSKFIREVSTKLGKRCINEI